MAGSVYSYTLSNGRRKWGFSVDLGMKWDEAKGRNVRQQLRREGYARKLDAERALQEEQHGVRLGTALSLTDRRLLTSEWADKWLASRVSLRPSTRASYRHVLDSYVKPAIGHIPLHPLRADHLDEMLALIRGGKIRPQINRRRGGDGRLAESAVKQVYVITQAMLGPRHGGAVQKRLIPFSSAVGAEFELAERPEPPAWAPAEVARFLVFAEREEPQLALGYRIALTFGLRRGELCGLRWTDIDTGEGLLHVRQQIVQVGGELLTGPAQDQQEHAVHPAAGLAGVRDGAAGAPQAAATGPHGRGGLDRDRPGPGACGRPAGPAVAADRPVHQPPRGGGPAGTHLARLPAHCQQHVEAHGH
jgi:hypothetical protein